MQTLWLKSSREKTYTSKYRGVSWNRQKQKWKAAISVCGIKQVLGYWDLELEAAKAVNAAQVKYNGPFAVLNVFEEGGK
jgi:hypothetical protein